MNKTCEHPAVIIYWRLYTRETRYEPAEYIGQAICQECGEAMEPEDVPTNAERKEVTQ